MAQNYNEDESSKNLLNQGIKNIKDSRSVIKRLLRICPQCGKKSLRRMTTDNELYSCFSSICGYAGSGRIQTFVESEQKQELKSDLKSEPKSESEPENNKKEITLYSEITENYIKISCNEALKQWRFMIYNKNFKAKCDLTIGQLDNIWDELFYIWNKAINDKK